MPGGTDQMVSRLQAEVEERTTFINGIVAAAQEEGRDLRADEMELLTRANDRLGVLNGQIGPIGDAARVAAQARERLAQINAETIAARNPAAATPPVEYRSAGAYLIDRWRAELGHEEARQNLAIYHRAAAHQTTADNLGVIPEPVVGGVVNFVDNARPVVTQLGPRGVPGGRFTRPKVTQHTDVAAQAAEKAELVSRKMLITPVQVLMATYGGYVNVSRQNIDWSVPSIMDLVIEDLAGEYAAETETATVSALETAATAGPGLPTGTNTADEIAGAIWAAAGLAYSATKGAGRVFLAVGPDMLGMLGPLFGQVNPTNAQGVGFSAANYASGVVGVVAGVPVVMSPSVDANTLLLVNTAAAEVYEQRIGSLQVTEPSVLGVQVAYAGYFAPIVMEAGGIVEITKTP